jgi:hypothetical protein
LDNKSIVAVIIINGILEDANPGKERIKSGPPVYGPPIWLVAVPVLECCGPLD